MKNLFTFILVLVFALPFAASAQNNNDYRGIWYYLVLNTPDEETRLANDLPAIINNLQPKGILVALPWWKIQPRIPFYSLNDLDGVSYHDEGVKSGDYEWAALDDALLEIAQSPNNLWIGLMIWTGPSAPIGNILNHDGCTVITNGSQANWLPADRNVGRFSTGGEDYYPDYLGRGTGQFISGINKSLYEIYWLQMLKDVLHHISKQSYRDKLLFFQSCEGTSGDVTPYKNPPCSTATDYTISDQAWRDKLVEWWGLEYNEINSSIYHDGVFDPNNENGELPNIHFMVNTGVTDRLWGYNNDESGKDYDVDAELQGLQTPDANSLFTAANTLQSTSTPIWRKATNMGHWYQQNFETKFKKAFDDLKASDASIMIRDELDFPGDMEFNEPDKLFAIAASALHSGLDMWMIKRNQVYFENGSLRMRNLPVFAFFNRHINSYKYGLVTPVSAFCVLRQGLDAALSVFSGSPFSCGPLLPKYDYLYSLNGSNSCNNQHGTDRTYCIGNYPDISQRGAYYDNSNQCFAQGGPYTQFKNSSNFDVGWYTFPAEYQRNLSPSPADLTIDFNSPNPPISLPYWNKYVESASNTDISTQGRFCRDIGSNKTLHFNVSNISTTGCFKMVVYFYRPLNTDCSSWKWKLTYQYNNGSTVKQSFTIDANSVTDAGVSGEWDSYTITINNPVFNGQVDGADFTLQNISTCGGTNPHNRLKFSTIEIYPCSQ